MNRMMKFLNGSAAKSMLVALALVVSPAADARAGLLGLLGSLFGADGEDSAYDQPLPPVPKKKKCSCRKCKSKSSANPCTPCEGGGSPLPSGQSGSSEQMSAASERAAPGGYSSSCNPPQYGGGSGYSSQPAESPAFGGSYSGGGVPAPPVAPTVFSAPHAGGGISAPPLAPPVFDGPNGGGTVAPLPMPSPSPLPPPVPTPVHVQPPPSPAPVTPPMNADNGGNNNSNGGFAPMPASGGQQPGSGLEFYRINATNTKSNPHWGPVLQDVMNHAAPRESFNDNDDATLAHEVTHGINSYIRNSLGRSKGNGFYLGEGRAVILPEPNMKLSQIADFIPQGLRGSRFKLYMQDQQKYFQDQPLYVFDEWAAYANGAAAAVDQAKLGQWKTGRRDGVAGEMEFMVYGLATMKAIQRYDPGYFDRNPQFKELVGFLANRTMESYGPGSKMPLFAMESQDKYLAAFKEGKDGESIRDAAKETLGKDWTKKNLDF